MHVDDESRDITGEWAESEIRVTDRPKVIIIGGGPNRIGQGIEFDYCCCQAAFAAKELGLESVMVNSNPETVSTDYDTSDLLFFEPLTHEDVLNVCERLNGGPFHTGTATRHDREGVPPGPRQANPLETSTGGSSTTGANVAEPGTGSTATDPVALPHGRASLRTGLVQGVVVQFGGQTPLNLAKGLEEAGVPILGTSVDAIHRAGSREQFRDLIRELGLKQPANGIARQRREGEDDRGRCGLPRARPPVVRPRRAGDGDRLRRGGVGPLHDPRPCRGRDDGHRRLANFDRQVSRRGGRG